MMRAVPICRTRVGKGTAIRAHLPIQESGLFLMLELQIANSGDTKLDAMPLYIRVSLKPAGHRPSRSSLQLTQRLSRVELPETGLYATGIRLPNTMLARSQLNSGPF
jgi:hypothetical protein